MVTCPAREPDQRSHARILARRRTELPFGCDTDSRAGRRGVATERRHCARFAGRALVTQRDKDRSISVSLPIRHGRRLRWPGEQLRADWPLCRTFVVVNPSVRSGRRGRGRASSLYGGAARGYGYRRGAVCNGHHSGWPAWFPGCSDELHRPGRPGARGHGPAGGVPAGDGDRTGWHWEDPAS
jgi:hypothetical protein